MIAESHLAIHTWPEYGYMAADFFTCGEGADADAAIEVLRAAFEAEHVECRYLTRGVPPDLARRFEEHEPGSASHAAYDVMQVLEQRRTEFQEIMLFEADRMSCLAVASKSCCPSSWPQGSSYPAKYCSKTSLP